jgi:hypothetical protein
LLQLRDLRDFLSYGTHPDCRHIHGGVEAGCPLPSMDHVQGGQVALDDAAVEPIVDKVSDAAEETLAGVVLQTPVSGVGAQNT